MTPDDHLGEWLNLTAQLLQRLLTAFPCVEIGQQLARSIPVVALTWEWRESGQRHRSRLVVDRSTGVTAEMARAFRVDENLERHPLVRWFTITGDAAPQTVGRVPLSVSPRRDRMWFADRMQPFGLEQQLALPCELDGRRYGAFVLSRPEDDFTEQDLALVTRLQPLLRGLHRQSRATAQAASAGLDPAALRTGANLTGTEVAVLALLAKGHTAHGIAHRLGNSPRTVTKHLEHIYRKLGVSDRLTAVKVANSLQGVAWATQRR
jgi:DNA-binding CsgD family transcriptional regulator